MRRRDQPENVDREAAILKASAAIRAAAKEIAGPGASFEEFEEIVLAVRTVLVERLLREERARLAGDPPAVVPVARLRRGDRKPKRR